MSNALKSILKFVTLKEQNNDLTEYTEYTVDAGNIYSEYTEYDETCDASDYP